MKFRGTEINSGSLADIAFLLLIFFLVTTTISQDKGVRTSLPPMVEDQQVKTPKQKLTIFVNKNDEVMTDGKLVPVDLLADIVYNKLIDHGSKHTIIFLKNSRSTSYNAYINVYGYIKKGYVQYQKTLSMDIYGKHLDVLTPDEKERLNKEYPLRLQESENENPAVTMK